MAFGLVAQAKAKKPRRNSFATPAKSAAVEKLNYKIDSNVSENNELKLESDATENNEITKIESKSNFKEPAQS